jgi:hypothetical protein
MRQLMMNTFSERIKPTPNKTFLFLFSHSRIINSPRIVTSKRERRRKYTHVDSIKRPENSGLNKKVFDKNPENRKNAVRR